LATVLGLGNPGDRYSGTRHNIGRNAVTDLIDRLDLRLEPGRGEFVFARDPSRDLILAYNTTYINLSGVSAVDMLERFELAPEDLLVVCDDFNLPFGTLRIRRSGGDAGHNGLNSIIAALGTEEFPRLRIGIGPVPEGVDPADFVLAEFKRGEREHLSEITEAAGGALLTLFRDGVERAMNTYNKKVVE
jgi:PTH1 family peptidyl-tRNA hydrolase